MTKPTRGAERGHALLLMMIVLVLGSLYGLASRLDAGTMKSRQAQATGAALSLARDALIAYAASYRDDPDRPGEVWGYLPCPDTAEKTGLYQPGDGTASATCGASDQVAIGLLPYKTLDLPELRDAEGNCLWYAVAGSFKNSPKPSTPLNWDTQGQLRIIDSGATQAAPDDANGGAAAVVFAPGPALSGQSRRIFTQPCGADPAELATYLESDAGTFVQGPVRHADGRVANNDRLAWIAPRDIFAPILARADFKNPLGTTPEGRLNRLIDAGRQALDNKLWADLAAQTRASTGLPAASAPAAGYAADYRQFAGKLVGDVPDLKPLAFAGDSYDGDFDHWRDQFRYAVCADLKPATGCLAFGAKACRGALLFAGQAQADLFPFGGPRPASQKPRTPPPSRSDYLAHYFEAAAGLDVLDGPTLAVTGTAAYIDAARAADVAVCVSPGAYATLAKDSGSFTRVASSAARPEASIDTAAAQVRLGNPAATAAGRGCAWLPLQLPFDAALRAYFRLRVADTGEGLVFAIADGTANQAAMANGSLCGGATAAQLGYAGGHIAAPKFGLEIDTRSQTGSDCAGANRNDPGTDHIAFVYWGSAASAADDNCHGAGTPDSGAQPLNPRTLARDAFGIPIGIRTVQASDPHLPYAGSLPRDTDIHVRLDVVKSYDAVLVQSAAWSDTTGTVTVATFVPHGRLSNQRVTISGMVPAAYDGSYAVTAVDANHFRYAPATSPGTYVSGGRVTAPPAVAVESASWNADGATITTATAHGFISGQPVSIASVAPAGYNGTHRIVVLDPTRFRYPLATDPGAYASGGTLTPAVALTLRVYVASRLQVFGASYLSTCSAADLQNLAANLDALCDQNASIAQEDVYMDVDAATGRALATIYAGFANAQNTGAAGRQSLTISNFAIATQ